jgi:hypothetical protein
MRVLSPWYVMAVVPERFFVLIPLSALDLPELKFVDRIREVYFSCRVKRIFMPIDSELDGF